MAKIALEFTPATSIFAERTNCIACASSDLRELAGGCFGDPPLRTFLEEDPWGEDPLPIIADLPWSLVACRDCGQAFHRHILSPEWNEIRFSRWMSEAAIRDFEAAHGRNHAADHVQHVLRLRARGVRRVLDFGCGFGDFLQMCRLFGLEAIGVDRSNARRSGAGGGIFAKLADVPGSFDAIALFEVLEHVDDPRALLDTLRHRLNPGGMLIVEVPNASGVTAICSREDYSKVHPLDHINAFTPATLEAMLRKAGFKQVAKPPAFVTGSLSRVAKDTAKAVFRRRTTQGYFTLAGGDTAEQWEARYFS